MAGHGAGHPVPRQIGSEGERALIQARAAECAAQLP
jgi:hypothetical protein